MPCRRRQSCGIVCILLVPLPLLVSHGSSSKTAAASFLSVLPPAATVQSRGWFVPLSTTRTPPRQGTVAMSLDDLLNSIFGDSKSNEKDKDEYDKEKEDDFLGLNQFRREVDRRAAAGGTKDAAPQQQEEKFNTQDFDGYKLRDVIVKKWGKPYDVEFQPVSTMRESLYLNIMPFYFAEGRGPCRHETEWDYLCHLQAVVEILQEYKQLGLVLQQIAETSKKPRAGTVPLVAVPLRLELTRAQLQKILSNRQ